MKVTHQKEKLRLVFKKLQEINPFKEIKNPLAWQRELRDEWERRKPPLKTGNKKLETIIQ